MAKMKNPIYEQVALETGGSHYPGVGGALLEQFADALVRRCAAQTDVLASQGVEPTEFSNLLKEHFGVKHD